MPSIRGHLVRGVPCTTSAWFSDRSSCRPLQGALSESLRRIPLDNRPRSHVALVSEGQVGGEPNVLPLLDAAGESDPSGWKTNKARQNPPTLTLEPPLWSFRRR